MTDREYTYIREVNHHIYKVRRILENCIDFLLRRFEYHDKYKLKRDVIEGGEAKPDYYYSSHRGNFSGTTLLDLLELVADMMSETTSIEQAYTKVNEFVNKYNLSKDLERVMLWTIRDLDRFYSSEITLRDKLEHAIPISKASTGLTTF